MKAHAQSGLGALAVNVSAGSLVDIVGGVNRFELAPQRRCRAGQDDFLQCPITS